VSHKNPKFRVSQKIKKHLHCEAGTCWVNPCHLSVQNMFSCHTRIQYLVFHKKKKTPPL
jgi:hypothetical protein